MPRLRASDLAAMFEVYMLAVALAALKTALDTRSSWYLEMETLWVLGTTFIGGVVLLGVILATGMHLIPPREPRRAIEAPPAAKWDAPAHPPTKPMDEDVDELLKSLETIAGPGDREAEGAAARGVAGQAAAGLGSLTFSRSLTSRRVLRSLVGPAVAATVFSGVSAAMLPGAGGMLQSYYTVNTFMILTLAYGWGGLIAYTMASLFLAASDT